MPKMIFKKLFYSLYSLLLSSLITEDTLRFLSIKKFGRKSMPFNFAFFLITCHSFIDCGEEGSFLRLRLLRKWSRCGKAEQRHSRQRLRELSLATGVGVRNRHSPCVATVCVQQLRGQRWSGHYSSLPRPGPSDRDLLHSHPV